jgi:hypothetical protein
LTESQAAHDNASLDVEFIVEQNDVSVGTKIKVPLLFLDAKKNCRVKSGCLDSLTQEKIKKNQKRKERKGKRRQRKSDK